MSEIAKLKNRIESLNVMRIMYESALKDSVDGSYNHKQLIRNLESVKAQIDEYEKTIRLLERNRNRCLIMQ